MPSKYVLWRVSNGWLMTYETTLWENHEHRMRYAVFHSLKEFSDWAEHDATVKPLTVPKLEPPPKPRHHGKSSKRKSANRIPAARNDRQPARA